MSQINNLKKFKVYLPFSLLFLGLFVFTITFPSSSRGLIIAPVTGSRGIGFRYLIGLDIASTPTNPIQQQLDQHALMKQVSILNKQLALLRANQVQYMTTAKKK